MQPTLELHPEFHQEFHLAEGTNSKGCCCFWKSKTPKEYFVKKDGTLSPFKSTTKKVHHRIIANQRLAKLVQDKFEKDPLENNQAFERLREKVNYTFDGSEKITEDALILIVNAIYQVKKELHHKDS